MYYLLVYTYLCVYLSLVTLVLFRINFTYAQTHAIIFIYICKILAHFSTACEHALNNDD